MTHALALRLRQNEIEPIAPPRLGVRRLIATVLDLTLTNPRQIEGPPPAEVGLGRKALSKGVRQIVVRPDQILQREFYRRTRLSLEGVVMRYILISAAIVATLTALAVLGLALLGA